MPTDRPVLPVSNAPQFVVAVPTVPTPIVTYTLIAANVAVYLAMCVARVSWIDPSPNDALRWGADFGPLSLGGEWWRLFTSMFVHYGIIHIGLNMWCLLNLGRSLEFLMGRKAFGATYLASGVAASIVSLWWHPMAVGAGASGAIFGVAGTFAAYVFLKRVALSSRSLKQTRNSLAAFIFYNLAFGAAIGPIDNSAHIGGLLAGAILGAIVPPIPRFRVRKESAVPDFSVGRDAEEAHANRVAWGIIVGSAIVLTGAFFGVRSIHAQYADYGRAVKLIRSGHADQGVGVLQRMTDSDTKMQLAPMLLAETLLNQGNPRAAIPVLEHIVAGDSPDVRSVQNLALAYVGTGKSAEALDQIARVISYEKDQVGWSAVFIRGVAEGESGDYARAAQDLQTALSANPDLTEARDDLARFQGLANHSPGATLPALAIPYSKIVAKSDEWPLFP